MDLGSLPGHKGPTEVSGLLGLLQGNSWNFMAWGCLQACGVGEIGGYSSMQQQRQWQWQDMPAIQQAARFTCEFARHQLCSIFLSISKGGITEVSVQPHMQVVKRSACLYMCALCCVLPAAAGARPHQQSHVHCTMLTMLVVDSFLKKWLANIAA